MNEVTKPKPNIEEQKAGESIIEANLPKFNTEEKKPGESIKEANVPKSNTEEKKPDESIKEVKESTSTCCIGWLLSIILVMTLLFALVFLYFFFFRSRLHNELLISEKDLRKSLSLTDDRTYRAIKLQNEMHVLIISDPTLSKPSVSLTVGAGSFQDDNEAPGLAHLTEHVIFSGSSSFANPTDFEDHLSAFYGAFNSFTEDEKTSFSFELNPEGFEKALELFITMFKNPNFTNEVITAQLETIDTELDQIKSKDQWREYYLIKSLSSPAHPFSRFSHGKSEVLGKIPTGHLLNLVKTYYSKYYTPNNMKMVVNSNIDIDSLEEQIGKYFGDYRIESKQSGGKSRYGEVANSAKAYTFAELGKIVWYKKKPGNLTPTLDLIFILDEVALKEKNIVKPLNYLTYMLKFADEGSLTYYLKSKSYAFKLDFGVIGSFQTFSQYAISIHLTENGLNNIDEILEITFAYINYMKKNTNAVVNKSIYDEISNMSSSKFNFQMKNELFEKPSDYLTSLSMSMFDYEYKHMIRNEHIHSSFNETMISSYIYSLLPENCIIILGSKEIPKRVQELLGENETQVDKNIGTKYASSKLNQEIIKKLNSAEKKDFKIRSKNIYITGQVKLLTCGVGDKSFSLLKSKSKNEDCAKEMNEYTPKVILTSPNIKVWHRLDRTFGSPKTQMYVNIYSQNFRNNNTQVAFLNLYFEYLQRMIEMKVSDAIDAGNEIKAEINDNGIIVKITSFTDMTLTLYEKIVYFFFNPEQLDTVFPKEAFEQMYLQAKERLRTGLIKTPMEKFSQFFFDIVKKGVTNNEEALNVLSNTKLFTYKNFLNEIKAYYPNFYSEQLIYGAFDQTLVKRLLDIINPFAASSDQKTELKLNGLRLIDTLHAHNLLDGSFIFKRYEAEEGNSISNYYQIGPRNAKNTLLMNLLELIWGDLVNVEFSQVKGVENVLSSEHLIVDNVLYYVFTIESQITPEQVNNKIDKLLLDINEKVNKLEDDNLTRLKAILKSNIVKNSANLKEKSEKAWNEIYEDSLDFKYQDNMINLIDSITSKDLIAFCKEIFLSQPRKLSMRIYGNKEKKKMGKDEPYGQLNKLLKSLIYDTTDFLAEATTVKKKRISSIK